MSHHQDTVPDLLGDETCEECESTGVNCDLHWENAARQEELDRAAETPATDIDLLNMLAAARQDGCPRPTSHAVDIFGSVHIHVHNADEACTWINWWTGEASVDDWTTRRSIRDQMCHHYEVGYWRGTEVNVLYLTKVEAPAEVTAP